MDDFRSIQTARIRGRVILTKDQKLFLHLDKIADSIIGQLKRAGLKSVRLVQADCILFSDHGWNLTRLYKHRKRGELKYAVDSGGVKISIVGSEMVAMYYARTLRGWIAELLVYSAWVIPLFIFLKVMEASFIPLFLVILGTWTLFERTRTIHLAMKRELRIAVRTTENVIEVMEGKYDTSGVEPDHRNQSPSDLLRSGYFYRNEGHEEKGRAYLAFLAEKYPWTDETESALKLIRENRGRKD